MSFEADLNAHLQGDSGIRALVAERIWPGVRPQSIKTLPAIVTTIVNDEPATDLDGEDGDLVNYRVQVDAQAATYDEAHALAELVRERMKTAASTFRSRPVTRIDDYEPDTRTHRVIRDFSCWYDVP